MATIVLDASVAVAAARPNEPHHVPARARIQRVLRAADDIVVPVTFEIEVTAALARRGHRPATTRSYVAALLRDATVVDLARADAALMSAVALRARLRAADAIYVWVAATHALPLCTLDDEVRKRAASECTIVSP